MLWVGIVKDGTNSPILFEKNLFIGYLSLSFIVKFKFKPNTKIFSLSLECFLKVEFFLVLAQPMFYQPVCKKVKFYDHPLQRHFTTVDHRHFLRLINFKVSKTKTNK
jgi:hypothetical protein